MLNRKALALLIFGCLIAGCKFDLRSASISFPIHTVKQECVTVQSDLPVGFLTGGEIILGDFSKRSGIGNIMTLTSTSSQPVYLPSVPIYWSGETSPDGQWFAYQTVKEEANSQFTATLIVLNMDGKIQLTLPWNEKWEDFYWLNNQQLEFPYIWEGDWKSTPHISDIVNVSTGQIENITSSLPDSWIPDGPLVAGLVVWKAVYDPTLSVAGYMRGSEPEQSFVLWDLQNHRELWNLNKWSIRETHPEWTPNGKILAVAVLNQKEDDFDRFELYLVNRDGHAEKWIDLKGYFKNASLSMSWSPNGRYLAIVPNGEQPFLILDTVAKELLGFCIPSKAGSGYIPGIWSKDNSQIIVPRWSESSDPSIVVDIKNNRAAYLTVNPKFRPIGWLASSP